MALQKMGCGEHIHYYRCNHQKKVSVKDQSMELSIQLNVNKICTDTPLLPACAELKFSLTFSYVPHKQSSLGQALDWTKCRLSGKCKMARGPAAQMGISNLSRSVTQISLWMQSYNYKHLNVSGDIQRNIKP